MTLKAIYIFLHMCIHRHTFSYIFYIFSATNAQQHILLQQMYLNTRTFHGNSFEYFLGHAKKGERVFYYLYFIFMIIKCKWNVAFKQVQNTWLFFLRLWCCHCCCFWMVSLLMWVCMWIYSYVYIYICSLWLPERHLSMQICVVSWICL